jgi:hypothetical protein
MWLMIIVGLVVFFAGLFLYVEFRDPFLMGAILIIVGLSVLSTFIIFTPQKFDKQKYTKSDTIIEVVAVGNDLVFKDENRYFDVLNFDFDEKVIGEKLSVRKIVRASDKTFSSVKSESSKYILILPKDFAEKSAR